MLENFESMSVTGRKISRQSDERQAGEILYARVAKVL
jgi:hypothetical protein